MTLLIRAGALTHYLEVCQRLGVDPAPLLAEVGLSKARLQHAEHRLCGEAAVRLLENTAAVSGCQTLGLSMAAARQLSDLGAVSLLLCHQRSLRDALQVMLHYRHLMNDTVAIHLIEEGGRAVIRQDVLTRTSLPSRQANELAMGVLFRLCATLFGRHWRPCSVHFTHSAPADLQLHRRLFACELVFGSHFNGIVCPDGNLELGGAWADPAMARNAQRYLVPLQEAGGPSLVEAVRKAIRQWLPEGRASIEHVAQLQGMNVRTFQRRLDDQGQVFSALVGEVRRELAVHYLGNSNYPLQRIAELLGFSVPTSFTRWFIGQFGMPPAVWRKDRGLVLRWVEGRKSSAARAAHRG
ncbi:AraC family transcriptional regulator [Pseudomonas sp. KU43P]|uniref:AraC family transcriptional regulator n=1 Tax=Pseudomonas sp. KU43P TaxID=2487887 RepID=UPI0012A96617|nr:AraC family transcriptional regulator [Pseudomonas sp. KU43P]BBH45745.1 AraC family transcriptional regulator [Pseudomonas sp. KU43P]